MPVLVAIEALALVLLTVLVFSLLRSHAAILRKLHELGAGLGDADEAASGVTSPVPFRTRPGVPQPADETGFADATDITGAGLRDDQVAVRVTGTGHHTVLAFLSSSCLTCTGFWDAFNQPGGVRLPPETRLVIVTKGPGDESPAAIAELAPDGITVVMSSQAWTDYRVPGSPYVVYVDGPTGRVRGEGTGMSWDQVANLLAQATGDVAFVEGGARPQITKPQSDAEREREVDQELMAAGIFPGDPSLYPDPETPDEG